MPQQPATDKCDHCASRIANNNLCPAHLEILKRTWYHKLEKTGFEDAEDADSGLLKSWSSRLFTARINGSTFLEKQVYYESIEEYYRLAGHFLFDWAFETELDRFIWKNHSEGRSIEAVVDLVRKSGIKSKKVCNKRNIHETIQRLCKKMKELYLTKKT